MTAAENRTLDALRTSGPEPDDVLHPECEGRRRQGARERVAAHELAEVGFTVNGTEVTVRVPARMHLADALREHLGLTGTHLGCEHGVCGMCTVLVDGVAARACLLFTVQCDGTEVVTVEGLGSAADQHPLQRAFSAHHGLQCGFCTPGMLLSSYDLLANGADGTAVDPADLPEQMSGVLCRCTGYRGILAAVADVAAEYPDGLPAPMNCAPRTLVGRGGGPTEPVPDDADEVGLATTTEVQAPRGTPSATVEVTSTLTSPVGDVWEVLTDFDRLARCLPGAELLETLDGDRYRGRAGVALGPVKLSFQGLAQVVERDAGAHLLHFIGQGADTGGSATQADVRLRAEAAPDGGTVLRADADLFLSGRIAQFGRALAGDVSRRLFEQFATAVDAAASGQEPPATAKGPSTLRLAAGAVLDGLRRRIEALRARLRRR